jgi:hypothetical protein
MSESIMDGPNNFFPADFHQWYHNQEENRLKNPSFFIWKIFYPVKIEVVGLKKETNQVEYSRMGWMLFVDACEVGFEGFDETIDVRIM